jgi:hypothetical protein
MSKTFIRFCAQIGGAAALGAVIAHLMVAGAWLYAAGLVAVFALFMVKHDWIQDLRAGAAGVKALCVGQRRTGEALLTKDRSEPAGLPPWWEDVKNRMPTGLPLVDQRKLRFRR